MLYLIEIPHQTTTVTTSSHKYNCCILSKFHIKPQQPLRRAKIIKCCILSKFHIKPQHFSSANGIAYSCILSKFHIKPQLWRTRSFHRRSCILSKFHIKPQHVIGDDGEGNVVSYRNSTSNHNPGRTSIDPDPVVSYRNSTSNHNILILQVVSLMLYLIEIPHQTTTASLFIITIYLLYLIEIPHQTTTSD